jgi:hypothetical protein
LGTLSSVIALGTLSSVIALRTRSSVIALGTRSSVTGLGTLGPVIALESLHAVIALESLHAGRTLEASTLVTLHAGAALSSLHALEAGALIPLCALSTWHASGASRASRASRAPSTRCPPRTLEASTLVTLHAGAALSSLHALEAGALIPLCALSTWHASGASRALSTRCPLRTGDLRQSLDAAAHSPTELLGEGHLLDPDNFIL